MTKTLTIFALLLVFTFGFLTPKVYAQIGSMMGLDTNETAAVSENGHSESVEVVLQELLSQQNVSTVQELDLSKVSDDDWERLGDAVMELQHPGEAHEAMDRMMGGEGSESLRQMHINMGQAYLGYGSGNSYYGPGMMTGGGMMGYRNNRNLTVPAGMMGFGSMMGYSGYGILGTVTWIMVIAFLASGTYFFLRKAYKSKQQ